MVHKIPRPKTAGFFVLFAAFLALLAGYLRGELVLSFMGTVFLMILFYFYLAVLAACLTHGKSAKTALTEILTKHVKAGGQGELRFVNPVRFYLLPGIAVRYRKKLASKDGRVVSCIFNPLENNNIQFAVPLRGAYYNCSDEILFVDVSGFFEAGIVVKQNDITDEPGLLAAPVTADKPVIIPVRSGGSEKRDELTYRKTDNLTENRPYVPGDDPRRIIWKLYGHGPNPELYVRERENSPPPHSRLLILLDTQIDPALYGIAESRAEIDMLCENALGIMGELGKNGISVTVGYTGGKILPGNEWSLAWPAALPLLSDDLLPSPADDCGVLILAAPRLTPGTALDRFLQNVPPGNFPDLFFLYTENKTDVRERTEAASAGAAFYKRKANVYLMAKE